jgi:hypothetical protein
MNASLYFELVDAIARVDGEAGLSAVANRVAATPMHPLERRVLERALRVRSEALSLQGQVETPPSFDGGSAEAKSVAAIG